MKRVCAWLLCVLLALGLTACGAPAQTPDATEAPAPEATAAPAEAAQIPTLFTPGQYEATVTGHNGQMVVSVTLGENEIQAIEVVEHSESLALGTVAMDHVKEEIIARQSLDVDMVSGATISGAALLQAVKQAVEQGGGDVSALMIQADADETVYGDISCDVVIVGSGSAGMAAAAEAGDLGLNTILVEQLGFLGGSSVRTGYLIGGGTKLQAAEGIDYPIEQIIESLKKPSATVTDELYNEESAQLYGSMMGENIDWLYDMGVEFGVIKYDHQFRGPGAARLGPYLITGLQKHLDEKGVEYRLNTRATSLVQGENGTVTGVTVTAENGSEYTISAPTVILATGGYFANQEMVKKYNPAFEGYPTDVCKGADGSGMLMAEAAGGTLICMDQANYHGLAAMYNGASRSLQTPLNNGAIVVNAEGKRFVNEKASYTEVAFSILEQEGGYAYCVMDQTMMDFDSIKNDVGLSAITDMYVQADTLEELAGLLGIDPEGLAATVEAYSQFVKNGVDEEFGKPADYLNSDYLTPPYYGVKASPETHTVHGGVVVDTYTHVLDSEGRIIPGLLAVGEVTASHVRGASTNSVNVAAGRLAAREAAKAVD